MILACDQPFVGLSKDNIQGCIDVSGPQKPAIRILGLPNQQPDLRLLDISWEVGVLSDLWHGRSETLLCIGSEVMWVDKPSHVE